MVAPLRFDVDDLTQAVVDITIEPGVPNQTSVILPEGERIVARLGGDDLLAIDNTAYAVARTRDDLSVAIHGDADIFLTTLLETLAGVTVVDPAVETPEIDIYVGQAPPEDSLRPFLAIASPTGVPGIRVTGDTEAPAVTKVETSDPLLTGLDLSRVRIATAQIVETETAEVLVGSPGAPLILRGRRGGVPYLYLSFAVADSTLPVDLVFPVLGQRMVEELGGAVTVPAAIEVGDLITPPAGRDTIITSPRGVQLSRPGGAGAVTVDEPGFWRVAPIGGADRLVAVTLGVEESDLEPLPVAPTDPRPLRAGEEPPTTDTSWRWVLVILALLFGLWEWWTIRTRRGVPRWQWRTASGLRIAAAVALITALLGATLPLSGDDVVTVFVLDRSDSVGRVGVSRGTSVTTNAAAAAPDDARMGVVVSADGARIEQLLASIDRSNGIGSAIIDGDRSDLASGLRLAGALLPDDAKRRVVVVSDGRATGEDPEAEALALGARGVPIDYVLLETTAGGDAAVLGLNAPTQIDEAAQVPIDVVIESTIASTATVTLRRDGEAVATTQVDLAIGANTVSFVDTPESSKLVSYTATVDMVGDDRPQNDTARTTVDVDGRAQVLIVEGTSEAGDVLASALGSAGIDTELLEPGALPAVDRLIGYDSIVLADVALSQLSNDQIDALVTVTRQLGRGLVTIGGPQSYGMGEYRDSALEPILPVISDVLDPQRLRQVAQVMALDTSESMGECHCADGFQEPVGGAGGVNKTAIARAGAARAISNLNANDEIGVLAVDTQERWLIDLQQLPSDDVIDSGLAEATPSGNTNLANTLPTAADALRSSNAALKHIILFTDGFTSQNSLRQMQTQAGDIREDGITISVVATGEGAARELAAIAEAGGGRFYPGRDLTRIPEILVQESILASRQFINEGEFFPIVTDTAAVVDDLTEAPPLFGFVATTAKPTARTALRIGPEEDPLLSSWQVGLGRVTSWTSDANPRWSQAWTSWDGYVDFWSSLVRDTFPLQQSGAVRVVVDGDLLRVRAEAAAGQSRVTATVAGPNGNQVEVRLREISPGVYEGTTTADSPGVYAAGVQIGGDEAEGGLGSAIATVSYAAEYRPGDSDEALLRRISEASGGRGAITAEQAFDAEDLESGRKTFELASWMLLAAALMWFIAAVLSRLWLGSRRTAVEGSSMRVEKVDRPEDVPVESRGSVAAAVSSSPEAPPGPSPVVPDPEPVAASASTVDALLKNRRNRGRSEDSE